MSTGVSGEQSYCHYNKSKSIMGIYPLHSNILQYFLSFFFFFTKLLSSVRVRTRSVLITDSSVCSQQLLLC